MRRKAAVRAPLVQAKAVHKNYTQSKLNLLIPSGHPSAEKPKAGQVNVGRSSELIDLSGADDRVQSKLVGQSNRLVNYGHSANLEDSKGGPSGLSTGGNRAEDESDPAFVKHVYDEETVKDYLYPHSDKYACREYQSKIVKSALLMNTLVVLPTGLGKTFIAAVVMCNYLRWFPNGKIIFMAPTRPLVTQQIEACHNIVGIDESVTAQLMGSVKPEKRALLWKSKRLFYCTPQTAEKDAKNDSLPARDVVLLVIDEAHRATGNYAYTNVVRHIRAASKSFRVLALSATPGKNPEKVQEVINNLLVAKVSSFSMKSWTSGILLSWLTATTKIEYKSESDPDVKPYVFNKCIEVRSVKTTKECIELTDMLHAICRPVLNRLCNNSCCSIPLRRDIKNINKHQVGAKREDHGKLLSVLILSSLSTLGSQCSVSFHVVEWDESPDICDRWRIWVVARVVTPQGVNDRPRANLHGRTHPQEPYSSLLDTTFSCETKPDSLS